MVAARIILCSLLVVLVIGCRQSSSTSNAVTAAAVRPTHLAGRWWLDFPKSKNADGSSLAPLLSSMFIDFYKDGSVRLWMGGAWLTAKHEVAGDVVRITPDKDQTFFAVTAGIKPGKGQAFDMPFESKDLIVWRTGQGATLKFSPNARLGRVGNQEAP